MPMKPDETWRRAVAEEDIDLWSEYLDQVAVADRFSFLHSKGATAIGGKRVGLHEWLNNIGRASHQELMAILYDDKRAIIDRLAAATYVRWTDRLITLLRDCSIPTLPTQGVVQYFSDGLAACILVRYRRPGSTVELRDLLAFPDPSSFFDVVSALSFARSDGQLELLRQSLFSRHKIVVHRNVLIHIDRDDEIEVFGPTIDTLILNEALFEDRYICQRVPSKRAFFQDPVPSDVAASTDGTRFLEVGCGNGLLTATNARNEAQLSRLSAIDLSAQAVAATYRNSKAQRRFPKGRTITDRARFVIGHYSLDAVPHCNDLVVCNPPYIPTPDDKRLLLSLHPLARATLGTDLLQQVVQDSTHLLAPGGRLYLIISDMAEKELQSALPQEFTCSKIISRDVPFDVGPVHEEKKLIRWLANERGLAWHKRQKRKYMHTVSVFAIGSRSEKEEEADE